MGEPSLTSTAPTTSGTPSAQARRRGRLRGAWRRWSWPRRILVIVCSLALLFGLVGLPVYVFPPQGDPTGADLAYIIGPYTAARGAEAERLRQEGSVKDILISVSPHGQGPDDTMPICREAGVSCEIPTPLKTRGEAAMLTEYTKTHVVHKTVVITFTPQVMRARFIFAKCYGGNVTVVGVDDHLSARGWFFEYLYQTAGFAKALVKSCPQ